MGGILERDVEQAFLPFPLTMDISVVLNAHHEGCLALPTIRSVKASLAHARAHGFSTEVIVVLDSADQDTVEHFEAHRDSEWKLESTEFSDLGEARNRGAQSAAGRFTAFLDADDLFSANWLTAAAKAAIAEPRAAVWHTELNVYFGDAERIFYHVDMDDPGWDDRNILTANYWTALAFAPTDLLRAVPYPRSDIPNQIGYEDWAWNEATIAHGIVHKTVPATTHFIRMKRHGSLLAQTNKMRSLPTPSGLILRNVHQQSHDFLHPL